MTNICTNLYKLDNVQFTATDNDDKEYTATFSFIIAPGEITYLNPTYGGDTVASVIAILPIIAIMGIVLAVVGVAVANRE